MGEENEQAFLKQQFQRANRGMGKMLRFLREIQKNITFRFYFTVLRLAYIKES